MTVRSECSSPETDTVVSFTCKKPQIAEHFLQEKISKISLPTRSQCFLGNLNPRWALLKNNLKKRRLMSELLAKAQLREKFSLSPALYNSKLVLSNQSRECQPGQGSAKSLGDGVNNIPNLEGASSLKGGAYPALRQPLVLLKDEKN